MTAHRRKYLMCLSKEGDVLIVPTIQTMFWTPRFQVVTVCAIDDPTDPIIEQYKEAINPQMPAVWLSESPTRGFLPISLRSRFVEYGTGFFIHRRK